MIKRKKIIVSELCQPIISRWPHLVSGRELNGLIRNIRPMVIDGTRSIGVIYSTHDNEFDRKMVFSPSFLLQNTKKIRNYPSTEGILVFLWCFGTKMMVRRALFIFIILIHHLDRRLTLRPADVMMYG